MNEKELTKRQKNVIRYMNTRMTPDGIRQLYAVFITGLDRQIDEKGNVVNYCQCPPWAKSIGSHLEHDELDDVIEKMARNWTNF